MARGSGETRLPVTAETGQAHGGVGETDVPLVLAVGDGSVADGLAVVGVPDGGPGPGDTRVQPLGQEQPR